MRREELHQPEVADEPALVPAEPLEADDRGRPGPEPALALEEAHDVVRRHRVQALGVEAPAEADERGAAAGVQPERSQPCRRQHAEVGGGRRRMELRPGDRRRRGADDPRASIARARRDSISWPQNARSSACATEPTRACRMPSSCLRRLPDQRIAPEAPQELGVVVVERELEPQRLDARRRSLRARAPSRRRDVAPRRARRGRRRGPPRCRRRPPSDGSRRGTWR